MNGAQKNGEKRVVFSETMYREIRNIIIELVSKTTAKAIIFADMNGHPISQRGDLEEFNVAALTALAAGEFAATAEMAKMIGESATFKLLFHEGTKANVYMSSVGNNFLILLIFDHSVALGIIRIFTNRAVARLNEILNEAKRAEQEASRFLDLEFGELLKKELDRSFGP